MVKCISATMVASEQRERHICLSPVSRIPDSYQEFSCTSLVNFKSTRRVTKMQKCCLVLSWFFSLQPCAPVLPPLCLCWKLCSCVLHWIIFLAQVENSLLCFCSFTGSVTSLIRGRGITNSSFVVGWSLYYLVPAMELRLQCP